ncbi:hypothetical protein [Bradyrhizobium sp. AZCC 2230]|uniref:hypothetical protein n=1 Tax=Bradyrhizobium sp. AZCC 2230 TaxID=3117021 RepID=UPI002FEE9D96
MTDQSTPGTSDLAVIYLARYAEGTKPIQTFIKSYERHQAGAPHDFILLRKGNPDEKIDLFLARYLPAAISLPDDGVDITSYAAAAALLPHRLIVCLNTFSEIASDDWLAKLRAVFDRPGVGIAGATGSYESPRASMRRLKKRLFLAQPRFFPSPTRLRGAFQFVRRILPKKFSRYLVNKLIARLLTSAEKSKSVSNSEAEFEAFWVRETKAEGTYSYFQAMPDFPNAHLRTNAFIIDRHIFLNSGASAVLTRTEAYLYEFGPDSLTRQMLRKGKQAIVVGRDGKGYDVGDWPRSRTFRLEDQANLLIHDNQTRAFDRMTKQERNAFASITWGEDHSASLSDHNLPNNAPR